MNTPEPHTDPPDPPDYCHTPLCDQCKVPLWECPGTGEGAR